MFISSLSPPIAVEKEIIVLNTTAEKEIIESNGNNVRTSLWQYIFTQ